MGTTKKRLKQMVFFLISTYVVGFLVLYLLQKPIFFHAKKLDANYQFKFNDNFRDTSIQLNNISTSIVHFYPSQKPKGVVLYCHGNQTNITRYAQYASLFTHLGYEVIMYDYPTYGKSVGKLTEENLYLQAEQMYQYTKQYYTDSLITIYGKSIGTGIASFLASKHNCHQLILETPYYSLIQLAKQWAWMYPCDSLMQFKIPAYQFIKNSKQPITIFHGTADKTIYLKTALLLKPYLKPTDQFIIIPNGKHNDLTNEKNVIQKLEQLLN